MKQYKCEKLSALCWDQVEAISLNNVVDGSAPRLATTAKMCFIDNFFCVRFEFEDDFICANMNGFNDKLYEEDVVEIFIDDDCDRKTYMEIEVNPNNAALHYHILNDLEGNIVQYARIHNPLTTTVTKTETGTITEVLIPLNEFLNHQGKWNINLYRIDRHPNDPAKDEYCSWCPTGKVYFHVPECFGELILPANL